MFAAKNLEKAPAGYENYGNGTVDEDENDEDFDLKRRKECEIGQLQGYIIQIQERPGCIAVFEGMFVDGKVCKAVARSSCDIANNGSWSLLSRDLLKAQHASCSQKSSIHRGSEITRLQQFHLGVFFL